MNKVTLIGRLTREPQMYGGTEENQTIARYTLAVDRRYKQRQGNEQTVDFINCIAFGKTAMFAQTYLHKGTKIAAVGRLQSGSYVNKDGQRVFATQVVVEEQEFAQSKTATSGSGFNNNTYSDTPEETYQFFN